jgi:chromosomal replication initiator protein
VGHSVTIEVADDALKDLMPSTKKKPLTIPFIQEKVAEHFGLEVKHLKMRKRTRALVHPRQLAMYLSRELTEHSLPQIGEEFGGRDHTTVLHAHDKISTEKEEDPSLKAKLHELERIIVG